MYDSVVRSIDLAIYLFLMYHLSLMNVYYPYTHFRAKSTTCHRSMLKEVVREMLSHALAFLESCLSLWSVAIGPASLDPCLFDTQFWGNSNQVIYPHERYTSNCVGNSQGNALGAVLMQCSAVQCNTMQCMYVYVYSGIYFISILFLHSMKRECLYRGHFLDSLAWKSP